MREYYRPNRSLGDQDEPTSKDDLEEFKQRYLQWAVRHLSHDMMEYNYGDMSRSNVYESPLEHGVRVTTEFNSSMDMSTSGRVHSVAIIIEEPKSLKEMPSRERSIMIDGLIAQHLEEEETDAEDDCDYVESLRDPDQYDELDIVMSRSVEYVFRPGDEYKQYWNDIKINDQIIDGIGAGMSDEEFAIEFYGMTESDEDGEQGEVAEKDLFTTMNREVAQLTKRDLDIIKHVLKELGLTRELTKRQLAKRARIAAMRNKID